MTTSTWQQTESDSSPMPLHVSAPDGTGPFPALVVVQHQSGVDEFIQGMTQRLAGAGYVAAAPNLYHRDGPDCQDDPRSRSTRLGDRRVINDVDATVVSFNATAPSTPNASALSAFAWAAGSSI